MSVPPTGHTHEPRAALAATFDLPFAFHRSTNPELWRTTVPLIVRLRCSRHKGLIATWLAIHWLIVLYSTREDYTFGVREIAEEAGVGRNELAGPNGHIQRLLALGLIQIVGYKTVKRGLRQCPVYHIDLPELERQSIEAIQELLRSRGLPAPPRPAPDPRQLALFDDVGPAHGPERSATSTEDTVLHLDTPALIAVAAAAHHLSGQRVSVPENGTVTVLHPSHCPNIVTALPESGTVTSLDARHHPEIVTRTHETGTVLPVIGPEQLAPPATGTVRAPNRDIDGEKERKTEGERAHAPDSLLALATAAAKTALLELIQQLPPHTLRTATHEPPIPAPPEGETSLPAPVLDLWGADRPAVLQRDRFQLEQLAATADRATSGYGAYWLGRAILMAEGCLEPKGQRPTITYIRSLLRRWQREGSWGSDLAEHEAEVPTLPAQSRRSAASPVHPDHPAVQAYQVAFGRTPNATQAGLIVEGVTDLATWQRVLTDWQANGWKESGVAKMIDRYRKETAEPDDAPPPSVAVIHRYPSLTDEERDRWIRRFHAATTPAEKRAVLAQLMKEHA